MKAAHILMSEGSAISKENIIQAMSKEILNDTLSNQIFESLEYLGIIKHSAFTKNLYLWSESHPSGIMDIIKSAIKEKAGQPATSKEKKDKVFAALKWMYENMKDYTEYSIQKICEKFGLNGNDKNAIILLKWVDKVQIPHVPGQRGRRFKYKWIMPEPSNTMVEALLSKTKEVVKGYSDAARAEKNSLTPQITNKPQANPVNPEPSKKQAVNSDMSDAISVLVKKRDAAKQEMERLDVLIEKAKKVQQLEEYKREIAMETGLNVSDDTIIFVDEDIFYESPLTKKSNIKYKHDRASLTKMISDKRGITSKEIKDALYPNSNSGSDEIKALSAMICLLKKEGVIEYLDKGVYAIKKSDK